MGCRPEDDAPIFRAAGASAFACNSAAKSAVSNKILARPRNVLCRVLVIHFPLSCQISAASLSQATSMIQVPKSRNWDGVMVMFAIQEMTQARRAV
jgi:D-aminopeptidase